MKEKNIMNHLVFSNDSEWLIVHATQIKVNQLVDIGRLLGVINEEE